METYINRKRVREAAKFIAKNLRDFKRLGLAVKIKFGNSMKISLRRSQPCIQGTA